MMTAPLALAVPSAPDWAFPPLGVKPPSGPARTITVPGSRVQRPEAALHSMVAAVDWFPTAHPAPPSLVLKGEGKAWACGYCHLPDGQGRPENAALAGLPKAYILTQLRAFADGVRRSPQTRDGASSGAAALMIQEAQAAPQGEWDALAAYFSRRPFVSRVKVVETDVIPSVKPQVYIYVAQQGPSAPLGERLIEIPVSTEDFEARDPHASFIAYVPKGAVAAGARLADSGGPAGQPCQACHGAGLKGALGPPLAGRSPSYILRQLLAFRAGTRANPEAAPMRVVAANLTNVQMIDLAAYAATLRP